MRDLRIPAILVALGEEGPREEIRASGAWRDGLMVSAAREIIHEVALRMRHMEAEVKDLMSRSQSLR